MTAPTLVIQPSYATLADAEGWQKGLSFAHRRCAITGSVMLFGRGNDVDILVDVGGSAATGGTALTVAKTDLMSNGWEVSAGYDIVDSDDWFSARRGKVNLIVVPSNLYDLWERALVVCSYLVKRGKLVADDKPSRAVIHAVILGELQQIDLMDKGLL